jgi:hypothetical protein
MCRKMKKIFIIFFVVAIITIIIVVFNARSTTLKQPPQATPTPTLLPTVYRGLMPGDSTEENAVKSLGKPVRTDIGLQTTTLVYPSTLGEQPINIEVGPDKKIYRVVEPLPQTAKFNDLSIGLGAPGIVLYGIFEDTGFRLYVYLKYGVALLANPDTQETIERWYFQPTNASTFKTLFAPNLSTQHNEGKQ